MYYIEYIKDQVVKLLSQETKYLMKSTKNTSRLNKAIEQLESGKGHKRDLLEVRGE